MTILGYMKKQAVKVCERGGTECVGGADRAVLAARRSALQILAELDSLEGFNVGEREAAARGFFRGVRA